MTKLEDYGERKASRRIGMLFLELLIPDQKISADYNHIKMGRTHIIDWVYLSAKKKIKKSNRLHTYQPKLSTKFVPLVISLKLNLNNIFPVFYSILFYSLCRPEFMSHLPQMSCFSLIYFFLPLHFLMIHCLLFINGFVYRAYLSF